MKPLNYAILKYFTTVERACTTDVMKALKDQYGHFKAFNDHDVLTAIMTAAQNGLLEESHFEMDAQNNLHVYFRAHEEGAQTINRYIKD